MSTQKRKKRLKEQKEETLKRFRQEKWRNTQAVHGVFQYIIVLDGLEPKFNVGKIFRSADALGAHEVHLIGMEYFDPAPAKGSFKWVPARFHTHFSSCHQELMTREYSLFVLEPSGGQILSSVDLPAKSAFILGHEARGISFKREDYGNITPLTIPQFGKVQSLNVSIAASIVMYEYIRRHGL